MTIQLYFFASDNGAHNEGGHSYLFFDSSGPLRGFKRSMYDGGIRTPMMVRWPNMVSANVVSQKMWSFWDFLPTAAEIAGLQSLVPSNIDGVSRLPTILGKNQAAPSYFYFEFCCDGNFRRAIRQGDWKGVEWSLNGAFELYNFTTDIGEQNNIARNNPTVVAHLKQLMTEAHVESTLYPSDPCNPGC